MMHVWTAFLLVTVTHARLTHDPRVLITETVPASQGNVVKGNLANDVTLNCFVENKPSDKDVRWQLTRYDNEGKFVATMPVSRDMATDDVNKWSIEKPTDFSWRLRIKAIQVGDEGVYSCFLQLTIDTRVLANRTLLATDVPRIIEADMSSDMTVRQGDTMELMCNASGRPVPTILWRREGNAVLPDGGVVRYDTKLAVTNVRATHRGRYFCEALNEMGSIQRSIILGVQYPPIVRADEQSVSQMAGYKRTLICYIDANPKPSTGQGSNQLSWTRNARLVNYDTRVYTRVLEGARGMLTYELVFWPVQDQDYGDYLCRARNSLGGPNEVSVTLSESSEPQRDKGFISSASIPGQTSLLVALLILLIAELTWTQ